MPGWLGVLLRLRGFVTAGDGWWVRARGDRAVELTHEGAGHLRVRCTALGAGWSVWGHRLDPGYTPAQALALFASAVAWADGVEPAPAA